jgi:hypothetical protein
MADEQQLLEIIASNHQGILAAATRAGYPHLTNVLYVWNGQERIARVSLKCTPPSTASRTRRRCSAG